MFGQIVLELDIKLNEEEHGKSYCETLDTLDPYVSESRVHRVFAVPAKGLRNDRHNGEKNTDKAVLEYADPNDLNERISIYRSQKPMPRNKASLHQYSR